MRRLRQETPTNAAFVGAAIDLVRATPATHATPEAKRRVWAALETSRVAAWKREQSPLSRARLMAATLTILCLAGTASAVVGRRWLQAAVTRWTAPAAKDAVPAAPAGGHRRPLASALAGHAAIPLAREEGSAPPPAEAPLRPNPVPERTRAATVSTSAPASRVLRRAAAERAPAPPERAGLHLGPSEVLDAMVALRRDHDPARASELLARYLTGHPAGALREEALVLSIEAAAARGDDGSVRQFAQQYSRNYPGGRFQSVVEGYLQARRN